MPPLHWAACNGHLLVVHYLIEVCAGLFSLCMLDWRRVILGTQQSIASYKPLYASEPGCAVQVGVRGRLCAWAYDCLPVCSPLRSASRSLLPQEEENRREGESKGATCAPGGAGVAFIRGYILNACCTFPGAIHQHSCEELASLLAVPRGGAVLSSWAQGDASTARSSSRGTGPEQTGAEQSFTDRVQDYKLN